jgi:3-hydroxybutyryl-CoA dehydrogenase
MELDDVRNISVIGAGLMGHGIALEYAIAGFSVKINDVDDAALDLSWQRIRESAKLMQQSGLLDAETAEAAMSRIDSHTDLKFAAANADIVVEAMIENLEEKKNVYRQLDETCPPHTIFASNSSSFMPSLMAEATNRPQQFVGAHYFNPPYLIPLVEVIRGRETSDETMELMTAILLQCGKKPVQVQKEVPGFIANRIQAAVWREILTLVVDGVATPDDVDRVVTTSLGRRWAVAGPFEITDLAGLDLKQAILAELLPAIASSPHVPAILNEKVAHGELGVKTGNGFRGEWTAERVAESRARLAHALTTIETWSQPK